MSVIFRTLGTMRSCDARCHQAHGSKCECCCDGALHGILTQKDFDTPQDVVKGMLWVVKKGRATDADKQRIEALLEAYEEVGGMATLEIDTPVVWDATEIHLRSTVDDLWIISIYLDQQEEKG